MTSDTTNKYQHVSIDYKIWLKAIDGPSVLGEGGICLLKGIKNLSSLKLSADEQNMSYRKAWGIIKKAENVLGFKLVEKHRGGKSGGNSSLTEEGNDLLIAFEELKKDIDKSVKRISKKFFDKIK